MIVVTVFPSIFKQMEFHLVQNQKETCHHDHIPFNLKRNGILVFSDQVTQQRDVTNVVGKEVFSVVYRSHRLAARAT